jgi:hypothetical protein
MWRACGGLAHLVARPLDGRDEPDCLVVPRCRVHPAARTAANSTAALHGARFSAELQHALGHVGLLGLLRRDGMWGEAGG